MPSPALPLMVPSDPAPPPCPACGLLERPAVAGPASPWRYLACARCGHESLWPLPSEEQLAEHYNTTYAVPRERYERRATQRLAQLAPWFPKVSGGGVLEVGCSYGAVLAPLAQQGWRAEGIELDARAAAVARTDRGLTVLQVGLDEASPHLQEAPYDLVIALHVIEHIPDPAAWLSALHRVLKPGGRLILATPNAASTAARYTGGYWEWRAAPDHVHLFTRASLQAMLGAQGFTILDAATSRGDSHGLGFELLRASAKRSRDLASTAGPVRHAPDDPARPSATWWYRTVQRLLEAASRPAEALLGADAGAELRIVAERR